MTVHIDMQRFSYIRGNSPDVAQANAVRYRLAIDLEHMMNTEARHLNRSQTNRVMTRIRDIMNNASARYWLDHYHDARNIFAHVMQGVL